MTAATLDAVAATLGSFWKFPPRDDELQALAHGVTGWNSLRPLADAVDYATRNFDDRPTVAWLLRDARHRRDLVAQPVPTRHGCPVCRGELMVDTTPTVTAPMITPCPRCRPVTHALWEAGAYALDAPRSTDPRFAHILTKHNVESRP